MNTTTQRGFSLVELVIVLAVVGGVLYLTATAIRDVTRDKRLSAWEAAEAQEFSMLFNEVVETVAEGASLDTQSTAMSLQMPDGFALRQGETFRTPFLNRYGVFSRIIQDSDGNPLPHVVIVETQSSNDAQLARAGIRSSTSELRALKVRIANRIFDRYGLAVAVLNTNGIAEHPVGSWSVDLSNFFNSDGPTFVEPAVAVLIGFESTGGRPPPDWCDLYPFLPDCDTGGDEFDFNTCELALPATNPTNPTPQQFLTTNWSYREASCPSGTSEVWRFATCRDASSFYGAGAQRDTYFLSPIGAVLAWEPDTRYTSSMVTNGDGSTRRINYESETAFFQVNGVPYGGGLSCGGVSWAQCQQTRCGTAGLGDWYSFVHGPNPGGTGVFCCQTAVP